MNTDLETLFAEVAGSQVTRLRFPAPRRVSVPVEGGKFYTVPWSRETVLSYRYAGGWFSKGGGHAFEDSSAAAAAGMV
jgi:hypothetical protein